MPEGIPLEIIRRRPTLMRAIHLAMEVSGLPDKLIYGPMKMDKAAFSRVRSGDAWLPQDERADQFLDIVHNEIPLIWWAEKRGYDWSTIRKRQCSLERENERLRLEIADRDRLLALALGRK